MFTHLHVHTQYSVLDGATDIAKMIHKCQNNGMNAIAITDHGSMFGVFAFMKEVEKINAKNPETPFKPIIGCEVYVAENGRASRNSKENIGGRHLILLAKSLEGYRNLCKMVSLGWIEGFYGKPRIDRELLQQYHTGIIACSACLGGELPKAILKYNTEDQAPEFMNLTAAEEVIAFYKSVFGEDYYIEIQRNRHRDQELANRALVYLADKHNIKYIATNDVHFLNEEDFDAHKILICLNTGKDLTSSDLSDDDDKGMAYTGEEYLKTPEEMAKLFSDLPLALENTREITDKIESFSIASSVCLPNFEIPAGFENQDEYLKHLTYEGAEKRYPEMTVEVKERIDFELETVKKMGFPGYFLIVNDFIAHARTIGVRVGPGRGSAAGSVVAYCLGITNVDPIKYHLLFERFLNPDRISMPDMDIDFDDEGRDKVLQYVIEKYGKEKVAQVVTFGTMATKSSIKDCARVLKLPLKESNRLSDLVPNDPKINDFEKAFKESPDLKKELDNPDPLVKKTLDFAQKLVGNVRNTGVHACAVIIAREDISNLITLSTAKNSEMPVTQYEGSQVEEAGLLKMDFLGLKTLSIINETLKNIKKRHGTDLDIDAIDFGDTKTYQLFSKGETVAVFQFESPGMRKHLQNLKPERFEDIIAMVSLYRPGPMDKIPSFIMRKQGEEKISYPFPEMERYLEDTYGITVYQEQVMLLAQLLANFTRGEADTLRKAMGKKQIEQLNKMETKFFEGCKANGHEETKCKQIWEDWKKFAEYAFNKSHATCYAYVAYQTAYLKANYPAEFMAANLTANLKDLSKITTLLDECKRMDLSVLNPDVNESEKNFTVNKNNEIRFGLGGLKNVGENAVESIVLEREKDGLYQTAFDFMQRIDLRSCNKRSLESLVKSGAFDSFKEVHRAQFFYESQDGSGIFLDKLIKNINQAKLNADHNQSSLFDGVEEAVEDYNPEFPSCEKWHPIHQLKQEKEVAGFYISGHPLDGYKLIIEQFCNSDLTVIKEQDYLRSKNGMMLIFPAVVTGFQTLTTAQGTPFGKAFLEDYNDSFEWLFYRENYMKFNHLFKMDTLLLVKASVGERFNRNRDMPAEYELKPYDIILLDDAFEKLCKKITLSLALEDATEELASYLLDVIKSCHGKIPVKIKIIEDEKNMSLTFNSADLKVNPEKFIKELHLKVPHKIDMK